MTNNAWKYIRVKNPLAKRGRLVLHQGDLMRMSSTHNGSIVLTSRRIVHPNCDSLISTYSADLEGALRLIESGIALVIASNKDNNTFLQEGHINLAKTIVSELRQKHKLLKEIPQ